MINKKRKHVLSTYEKYFEKYVEVFRDGITDLSEQLETSDYNFYSWYTVSVEHGDTMKLEDQERYNGISDAIYD